MLRLNGGYSVGMIPKRMKIRMERTLKMNMAPRMKSTKMTIRKIVTMKTESLLKQDSSLLKQDSSLLKQDSSLLKQDSSLLKQDSMVA